VRRDPVIADDSRVPPETQPGILRDARGGAPPEAVEGLHGGRAPA
jgi:hypothetical protein